MKCFEKVVNGFEVLLLTLIPAWGANATAATIEIIQRQKYQAF